MTEQPTPLDVWERIARHYISIVDSAPHNALYERPAMVELLGDVSGIATLDIGCGSGFYLEWLLTHRSLRIAGVDGSTTMVEACLKRTSGQAEVVKADISKPLCCFEDNAFDLIVGSLVLHYLQDWGTPLREFNRLLRGGGTVVLSVSHPLADLEASSSKNYFDVERIVEDWSTFNVKMPSYRRPFSSMLASFRAAGFVVTDLVEPLPLPEMAQLNPSSYAKLVRQPNFVCLKLKKN